MIIDAINGGGGGGGGTVIVPKPTVTIGTYTYDGTEQGATIEFTPSTASKYCVITNATATNAGTYTLTIALKNTAKMVWGDMTTADLTYSYTIGKAPLTIPTLSTDSFTYDGSEKSLTFSDFDGDLMIKSGDLSGTNVGNYSATISLIDGDNYKWSDNTSNPRVYNWTINKIILTVPTVSATTKTYSGSAQSPTITGFDSTTMTKTGDSATNVGSYTVSFDLIDSDNYQWNSSTTSFAWTINKATVTLPAVTNTSKTYNGSVQSPTIASYDTTKLTVSGNSATNAGNYTVVFSLVDSDNYQMSGTNNVAWSIARATSAITLSSSSVTLNGSHLTRTVTVSNVKSRTLSVSTSNSSVATASVSGSTVTISNVNQATGTATITVTAAQSTNYNSSSKTISVTASFYAFPDAWLTAGGLNPSSYANLSAVLADETAVRRLFTIHASVDHLVTYKKQIGTTNFTTIINNDYCAKWINLRDYALDTLYANSTIKTYMDTADKYFYGEWVITDSTTTPPTWGAKGNVPIMTSNTAPYGKAIALDYYSGYSPYQVFDDNPNTLWASATYHSAYVGYKFTNPICVRKIKYRMPIRGTSTAGVTKFVIQASNDGTNWDNISDEIETPHSGNEEDKYLVLSNNKYYTHWVMYITYVPQSGQSQPFVHSLQFYGREMKVSQSTQPTDGRKYLYVNSKYYTEEWGQYDWDTDNPRKYIYDHGVEPSGTITGGTKGEHALTLSAVGTATLTINTTSYTAMGGKAGMRASGTNALKCGSATSNFTAANMPYGNGIDITSVNGSNAVGIAQTSAGTFDAEEVWIA